MNDVELNLISELRKDSNITLMFLSEKLNMPVSTVHSKIKQYSRADLIKCAYLLNFKKLGFSKSIISIKTNFESRDEIQVFLSEHPNINNLHKINSGFDFLIEVVGKDQKEIEDFINELKSNKEVLEIQTYSVIEDIQREKYLQY